MYSVGLGLKRPTAALVDASTNDRTASIDSATEAEAVIVVGEEEETKRLR